MLRRLLCMCLLFTVVTCCRPERATATPLPDAALTERVSESVVRVDVGNRFACTGIVVSSEGYVVVRASVVLSHENVQLTVGDARIPARIIATDTRHGLMLLHASSLPGEVAALAPRPGPARGTRARIIGYESLPSDPPMIAKRRIPAQVDEPHFTGESAANLCLSDIMLLRVTGDDRGSTDGMGIFSSVDGTLVGVVIGSMGAGDRRLIVMPASVILTLVASAMPIQVR